MSTTSVILGIYYVNGNRYGFSELKHHFNTTSDSNSDHNDVCLQEFEKQHALLQKIKHENRVLREQIKKSRENSPEHKRLQKTFMENTIKYSELTVSIRRICGSFK
jgi:hypothetical protein